MSTHTVTADPDARGCILIKDGPVLVTSIWCFDISSVGVGAELGDTQISMRGTEVWHQTSATVADVHRAISTARALWVSSSHNPARRRSA